MLGSIDPTTLVSTVVLVCAPLHIYSTRADLADVRSWIGQSQKKEKDEAREGQIKEELTKVQLSNYRLFSRCLAHLDFFTGVQALYDSLAAPSGSTVSLCFCYVLAYLQHLMVGKDSVKVTPARLKFLNYLLLLGVRHVSPFKKLRHVLTVIFAVGMAWADPIRFSLLQSFLTSVRFCLVLCFLDPLTTIPFQALRSCETSFVSHRAMFNHLSSWRDMSFQIISHRQK